MKQNKPVVQIISGNIFGSTYSVKYIGLSDALSLSSELDIFFKDFNQEFSTYQNDSTITKLNLASAGKKIKVTPRFIEMLELIKKFHLETKGAFDPSIGAVVKLWGFYGKSPQTPSAISLQKVKKITGMSLFHWDASKLEVWKTEDQAQLDLNAFAPGWAADLVGEKLILKKIVHFMVDIGGEILVKGQKGKESWIVAVEKPSEQASKNIQLVMKIKDLSIATSGNYRNFFRDSGVIRSHLIDPITVQPVTHQVVSASVLASSTVQADVWGTAIMILGSEGLDLAQNIGIKALIIIANKQGQLTTKMNPLMKEYLQSNQL